MRTDGSLALGQSPPVGGRARASTLAGLDDRSGQLARRAPTGESTPRSIRRRQRALVGCRRPGRRRGMGSRCDGRIRHCLWSRSWPSLTAPAGRSGPGGLAGRGRSGRSRDGTHGGSREIPRSPIVEATSRRQRSPLAQPPRIRSHVPTVQKSPMGNDLERTPERESGAITHPQAGTGQGGCASTLDVWQTLVLQLSAIVRGPGFPAASGGSEPTRLMRAVQSVGSPAKAVPYILRTVVTPIRATGGQRRHLPSEVSPWGSSASVGGSGARVR
jgi:hypothetical protein